MVAIGVLSVVLLASGPPPLLSFKELFEASARELKPSQKLLALNGKRVKMVGYTGNRLTISGTRVEEERRDDDRYYAMERAFGTFTRIFTLPEDADLDRIEARLDGGVLTVMVPKKESSKPRRIPLEGLKKTVEQLKEKVVEKLKR